ncbi:MAG: redoxin domain-containing protein [Chloroflexota bacterium]
MDNPNTSPETAALTPTPAAPNKISPVLLVFLIFPLLGIVAAFATGRPTSGTTDIVPPPAYFRPTTLVGRAAPDFTLQHPDGSPIQLNSLRGQWVFLNFWATWCPPCQQEMPTFQKFLDGGYGDYKGKATVLAVNRVETADQVNGFLKDRALKVPVALDSDATVHNQYGILNLPVTLLIDPSGVVRYEQIGEMTPDLLMRYLAAEVQPNAETF